MPITFNLPRDPVAGQHVCVEVPGAGDVQPEVFVTDADGTPLDGVTITRNDSKGGTYSICFIYPGGAGVMISVTPVGQDPEPLAF